MGLKKIIYLIFGILCVLNLKVYGQLQKLQIGPEKRFLVKEDGSPFVWIGETNWDVIHFNWGLHDLMHYLGTTAKEDRVPHTTANAFRRNSPEQYEAKLRELVATLQATGATLIWASTTPIPDSAKGIWKPGDSEIYNQIAAKVMKENNVIIDDLWTFTKPKLAGIQKEGDVHFLPEGSSLLGSEVARVIEEALQKQKSK